jgi:hypothetical protein
MRHAEVTVERDGKVIRLVGREETKIVFSLDFTPTQATDMATAFIKYSLEADLED